VKFTSARTEARIEFGVAARGEESAYYVRDNGVGFDMRYADKLFAAFQRLHSTDEFAGTGIGLTIVQRIVHRHGGACGRRRTGKGRDVLFHTLRPQQGGEAWAASTFCWLRTMRTISN